MNKIVIMSAVTATLLTTVSAESTLSDMLSKMKESVASMSQGAKDSIEAVKVEEKTEEVAEKTEEKTEEDNESKSFLDKVKDVFQ
jgi:ribosomal protein L12E/L44/L45/RPP1/RPP2